ncbi:hypothetical protein IWQ60_000046 [Tieghemiomyces parasiticus]|uniref:SAM domain-containing protein n=1 Tax=Tieghemiomyces parasiticus TaxID=78921 RepID=A0A9W8AMH5_9FUNG|nr:hypothetical protein IWQ60_000046 [Tieghemiomyces parasiticus]
MAAPEPLTQWDVNKVYAWFCSLGFQTYEKEIRDNEITGEVLVHLHHDALRDLSIQSLGKRLVILKAIYQLKVQHRIPLTGDDYIPPDVEGPIPTDGPGGGPHARAAGMGGPGDEVLNQVESLLEEQETMITHLQREVSRLTRAVSRLGTDFDRFQEEVRPVFSASGSASAPIPHPLPAPHSGYPRVPNANGSGRAAGSLAGKRPAPIKTRITGSPKSVLGGHFSQSAVSLHGPGASTLSPMTLLGSGTPGGSIATAMPASPSSPSDMYNYKVYPYQDIGNLKRSDSLPGSEQNGYARGSVSGPTSNSGSSRHRYRSTEKVGTPPGTTPLVSNGDAVIRVFGDKGIHRENESYKAFRISFDDTCHKVLPQALKKYNIADDWRNYSLCIMCGKAEHRLQLDDRPLRLFQQLQAANLSPYFVLKSLKSDTRDD